MSRERERERETRTMKSENMRRRKWVNNDTEETGKWERVNEGFDGRGWGEDGRIKKQIKKKILEKE